MNERIDEIEKINAIYKNVKGRCHVKELDSQCFYAHIIVKTTVCPNFKSQELREAYKTEDPIGVAKRVLSLGGGYDN
jgi:hypothetical protein